MKTQLVYSLLFGSLSAATSAEAMRCGSVININNHTSQPVTVNLESRHGVPPQSPDPDKFQVAGDSPRDSWGASNQYEIVAEPLATTDVTVAASCPAATGSETNIRWRYASKALGAASGQLNLAEDRGEIDIR